MGGATSNLVLERRAVGYAICTVPRSGSNWLCQLLSSTGELGYPLEYFNAFGRRLFSDADYPDDPDAQIDRILNAGATPNGVYGVKIFPAHLANVAGRIRWTERLENLRFVHFQRRDLLGQALSWWRAQQSGRWRSTQPGGAPAEYDGEAVFASLRRIVREQARWSLFFARNGIEPLALYYEDLQEHPQSACDALAGLLDLQTAPRLQLERVDLEIQRDAVVAQWRERFNATYGNRDTIDDFQ